jgi:threonine dehydrogenase-like Zn-dependent dehydrogenase
MSLAMTPEAFAYSIGDKKIISTLCPGGKARMSRLISIIGAGRVDLWNMVAHTFSLDEYEKAYDYFANKKDGCIKVALKP